MSFNKSFDDLTVKHPVLSSAIIMSASATANGTIQYTDAIELRNANAWNCFLSLDINAIDVADMPIQVHYSLSADGATGWQTAVEISDFTYVNSSSSGLETYGVAFDPSDIDIDTYPYIKFGYEVTLDGSETGNCLGSLLVLGTRPMDIENVDEVATLV